ncbi:MAG TPA: hypothetical protein VFR08_13330 [Candidatus Angelobacter sp.]|nr:hypothetical protein [Candidatus Angelobacter sp.]
MSRLPSIALLGALILIASAAQSQMRGGGGGGGMRGGGGIRMSSPAPHVSAGRPVGSGFSSGPAFRSGQAGRPAFSRGPFSPAGAPGFAGNHFTARNRVFFSGRDHFFSGRDHRFHSRFFHHRFRFNNGFFGANCFGFGFGFGNPFCGSFISSGLLFVDPFFGLGYGYGPGYSYPPPDYYPSQSATSNDNNEVALTAEIQRLSDEIQDLRDERKRDQQTQERPPASSGATLSAVPPSANTIFVLRDGRRITAKNYAISGQTLWILNENTARKTPLSDVDRAATEKANAENGIEIHLPEPK